MFYWTIPFLRYLKIIMFKAPVLSFKKKKWKYFNLQFIIILNKGCLPHSIYLQEEKKKIQTCLGAKLKINIQRFNNKLTKIY